VRVDDLRQYIRDIPNFPTEGVIFRDITPLLKNPDAFATTVDLMAEAVSSLNVTAVAAVEARGFIWVVLWLTVWVWVSFPLENLVNCLLR